MKPSPRIPARPGAERRRRATLLPLAACLLAAVALATTGCLRLGSDAGAVRDAVRDAAAANTLIHRKIELRVGAISLGLARGITAFVDLPPEARAALRSARAAEVGVYEIVAADGAASDRPAMLARATETLRGRGWERVVAVLEEAQAVAIFVPRDQDPEGPVRLCALVIDGREMVLASALVRAEPLAAIVAEHIRRERADRT